MTSALIKSHAQHGYREVNIKKAGGKKRRNAAYYTSAPPESRTSTFPPPIKTSTLEKKRSTRKRRWSGSRRRQKKTERHSERRSDGETEAEENSGGWQALLSAESDMAVGDRWQNQKVMSLLTGSACAPLISPVPPRHHRAHLCSSLPLSLPLSVSAKLADRMAGWQAERQATGRVWSGTGASGASGMPPQNPPSLPFYHVVSLLLFLPLHLSNSLHHTEPL